MGLAAVLVAAWAVAGDSSADEQAAATMTSSRGALSHSNSGDGTAILSASGMTPGDSTTGRVTIENTGQVPGGFYLTRSSSEDSPGPGGGVLSRRLDVAIDESTGSNPARTVHQGRLGSMGRISLGRFAPGERRTYTFIVAFADNQGSAAGGTPDNAYQGSATNVGYDWTAVAAGGGTSSGGGSDGHSGGGGSNDHDNSPGAPAPAPAPRIMLMRQAGLGGWVERPGFWVRMGVAETLRGGVPVRGLCSTGCRLDGTLSLNRRVTRGAGSSGGATMGAAGTLRRTPRPVVVGRVSRTALAPGALDAIIKPTTRGRRRIMQRLRRADKTRVTLLATVVDDAGNRTTLRRTILLHLGHRR